MSQPQLPGCGDVSHALLQDGLVGWLQSAASKMRVVASELSLAGEYSSMGRIDVVGVGITTRYASFDVAGFEVKATSQDLARDIRSDKWRKYEQQVNRLSFAIPLSLLEHSALAELPKRVGIITTRDLGRSWQWHRTASKYGGELVGEHTLLRITQALSERSPASRFRRVAEAVMIERGSSLINGRVKAEINEILAREQAIRIKEADIDRKSAQAQELEEFIDDAAGFAEDLRRIFHHISDATPNRATWGARPEFRAKKREQLRDLVDLLEGGSQHES